LHPLLVSKGHKPRKGVVFKCDNCSKEVYKHPHRVRSAFKRKFCARACQIEFLKKTSFRLNCVICQAVFFCQPCQVDYRHRKTCSVECRSKMKTKLAEEKRLTNPPTKHALDRRIRYSKKMFDWRKAIFARDDYTCQFCRVRGGYIEADHIKPFAYFPELRFDINNGRTLCVPCHKQTPNYFKKLSMKQINELYTLSGV